MGKEIDQVSIKGCSLLNKKIVFTGGGTAGHVTVNLALIPKLKDEGWQVFYIGSEKGIEKQLISTIDHVPYHSIATGKLRRYFDWNNLKDPFRVVKGMFQAYRIIRREKPHILFSKGGFVAVPVVLAAWLNRVPVITHESDLTPGLANKIAIPFVTKVCVTFPETTEFLPSRKAIHVGAVIRDELLQGSRERGLELCGFSPGKPVLLIMGGSLGARTINAAIRDNLERLTSEFQIVHICGKGNMELDRESAHYRQFEFVQTELPDLLAMSDVVISRAGSNAIFEFLTLQKPMLLIPLPKSSSRGDQILNAENFKRAGFAKVLLEEDLTNERFIASIHQLYTNRSAYIETMKSKEAEKPISKVISLIKETAK